MRTTSREWTVLTWNLQGAKRTDLDRVAAVISEAQPDVAALQEVRKPQAKRLAEHLSMTRCWAEKHNLLRPLFAGWAEGAAILSPHHMSGVGHTRISAAASKRTYRRRIVQWATIARDDASGYRIYNAHFSPHDLSVERFAEAARVADLIEDHGDTPPVVVAGDFNDADEPQIVAELPGVEAAQLPLTNPADTPRQTLDHVLVPADATIVSISAPPGGDDWEALSDHLPVTVRFTLDWVEGDFAG